MDYRDNQQEDLCYLYLDLGVLVRRISFLCHRCVTVVEVLDSTADVSVPISSSMSALATKILSVALYCFGGRAGSLEDGVVLHMCYVSRVLKSIKSHDCRSLQSVTVLSNFDASSFRHSILLLPPLRPFPFASVGTVHLSII